jgi:hypothetical protein
MNGISPQNYRPTTAKQERRATIALYTLCVLGSLAFAIYIPFKPHATGLDTMAGGACILAAIVCARELWRAIRD